MLAHVATRLAAAVAVALVLALSGAAILRAEERARAGPPFTPSAELALRFDPSLTAADRLVVLRAIESTRPEARALLTEISGEVTITRAENGGCPTMHMSCVYGGDPNDPDIGGRPIVVAYHQVHLTTGDSPIGRFLLLHELGHAVDAALLQPAGRRALATAIRAGARHAGSCRPGSEGCVGIHEAFADEFARWAGRYPGSLSAYGTPALVPDDRFGALVERYARPQPPARMFGAWPQ